MNSDELLRENAALPERLPRMSQTSLRITEDLDPSAVLLLMAGHGLVVPPVSYRIVVVTTR